MATRDSHFISLIFITCFVVICILFITQKLGNNQKYTQKNITISVIIPIYNMEKYLDRCLKSVINQTMKDIEIICVNDGSIDSSMKILKKYQLKDKRIQIISQKNGGLSAARNSGLRIAKGKYIYFIDADDYTHPQTLSIACNVLEKTESDFVCFFFHNVPADSKECFDEIDEKSVVYNVVNDPVLYWKVSIGNVFTKLYKRSLIGEDIFKDKLIYEDAHFNMRIFLKAKKYACINESLYCYSITPNSITRSKFLQKNIDSYLDIMKLAYDLHVKYNIPNEIYNQFLLIMLYEIQHGLNLANVDILNYSINAIKNLKASGLITFETLFCGHVI